MNDCEAYEVAIEQQRLGETSGVDPAALEAHLATCASCRAFASVSAATEAAMTRNDAPLDTIDFTAHRRQLLRTEETARSQLLLTLLSRLAALPLFAHAIGGSPAEVTRHLCLMLVALPFVYLLRVRMDRPLVEQAVWTASRGEDFFRHFRVLLERQERGLKRGAVLLPLVALFIDAVGIWSFGRGDTLTVLCRVILVVAASMYSAWMVRVPLARTRRIREQLP